MVRWIWFVIALVIVVVVLAARGRRGVQAMGQGFLNRKGHRSPLPDRPRQAADDSMADLRRDPNVEYQGEVYFFCTVEARDAFTANLRFGEFHPNETANTPRAIARHK